MTHTQELLHKKPH